jgi:hypothetical protein
VKRLINRLKRFYGVATRYEKLAVSYLAMVTLAAILILVVKVQTGPRAFTSRVGRRGCARLALSIHARPSCSKYCFIIANVRRFSLRMGRTIIGRRNASTPDSRGVVVR